MANLTGKISSGKSYSSSKSSSKSSTSKKKNTGNSITRTAGGSGDKGTGKVGVGSNVDLSHATETNIKGMGNKDTAGRDLNIAMGKVTMADDNNSMNGLGYAYKDKYGFSHVVADKATADKYSGDGDIQEYNGVYRNGYARDKSGARVAVDMPGVQDYGNNHEDQGATRYVGLDGSASSREGADVPQKKVAIKSAYEKQKQVRAASAGGANNVAVSDAINPVTAAPVVAPVATPVVTPAVPTVKPIVQENQMLDYNRALKQMGKGGLASDRSKRDAIGRRLAGDLWAGTAQ
jgi:hypothetical protein